LLCWKSAIVSVFPRQYSVGSWRGLRGAERVPARKSHDAATPTPSLSTSPCCLQPWARHSWLRDYPAGPPWIERLQIPRRLMQDALGAHHHLLMVKDSVLRRGHDSAGLALEVTALAPPSPTARLHATFVGNCVRVNPIHWRLGASLGRFSRQSRDRKFVG